MGTCRLGLGHWTGDMGQNTEYRAEYRGHGGHQPKNSGHLGRIHGQGTPGQNTGNQGRIQNTGHHGRIQDTRAEYRIHGINTKD